MKIIRFAQGGEIIQLGINKKELHLKWGELQSPMRLGELKDIKQMSRVNEISMGEDFVKIPAVLKQMSKNITDEGLQTAEKYTNKEFYNDFLRDFKEMGEEGQLVFLGEYKKWV
jgi:hypothetical protein